MIIVLAAALSALEIGVGFDCGARTVTRVTVIHGMTAAVEIPRGCPLAASELLVRLDCEKNQCSGGVVVNRLVPELRSNRRTKRALMHEEEEVASITGTPKALRVRFPAGPVQDLGAALRVTVVGESSVEVPETELRKLPVRVRFAGRQVGALVLVREGERSAVGLNGVPWGASLVDGKVRIDRNGEPVADLEATPGAPVATRFGVTVSVER